MSGTLESIPLLQSRRQEVADVRETERETSDEREKSVHNREQIRDK